MAGSVGLLDVPVFPGRVLEPAKEGDGQRDDPGRQQPRAEHQPASSRAAPSDAISGRNDGPACARPRAGRRGRPPGAAAGSARRRARRARSLAQPVQQADRQADRAEHERQPAEDHAEEQQERPDRREDRRERRTRHVHADRRARLDASLPATGRAARAIRQNWITRTTRTSAKMATGSRAISPPQSGMTNWDVNSRMLVQRSSSIRGPRSAAEGGGRSHGHSFGDPATRT